jgi:hypothetical protein
MPTAETPVIRRATEAAYTKANVSDDPSPKTAGNFEQSEEVILV